MEHRENLEQNIVSYANIDFSSLQFSEEFKCARSSAGQIVAGLDWMASNTKEVVNEYQLSLYKHISIFATEICNKYRQCFMSVAKSEVTKRVFGFHLNGYRNDGKLNRPIVCNRVNLKLRYKYVQFGQLLNLLYNRLDFISKRDPSINQYYINNVEDREQFEKLAIICRDFCNYLRDGGEKSLMSRWAMSVNALRVEHNINNYGNNYNSNNYNTNNNGQYFLQKSTSEVCQQINLQPPVVISVVQQEQVCKVLDPVQEPKKTRGRGKGK